MPAWDWNGHSYSASITLAADLKASSTLPFSFSTVRLRTVDLRMWSYSDAWGGNGGANCGPSTLGFSLAWMASHFRSATTPKKPFFHTPRAPGLCLMELCSTFTGCTTPTWGT